MTTPQLEEQFLRLLETNPGFRERVRQQLLGAEIFDGGSQMEQKVISTDDHGPGHSGKRQRQTGGVPKGIAYTLVFGSATAIMVSGFIFGWLS